VHPRIERARTDERVCGYEIIEFVGPKLPQHVGPESRLELKHTGCSPGAEKLVRGLIVEVDFIEIDLNPMALADHLTCVVYDGERSQAEEVHLQHADLFEGDHVELRDE
jgi:hypothetical protein